MSWRDGKKTAAALVALAVIGVARAGGVDLFPPQSWASLSQAAPGEDGAAGPSAGSAPAPATAASTSQPAVAAPAADPRFTGLGEWREAGQRIVVLASADHLYWLCQRCSLAFARRPGGELRDGYRLKALESQRAVLQTPDGRELSVDLAFSSQSSEAIGPT